MSKTADEQKIDKAVEEIIQLLEARPGEWEVELLDNRLRAEHRKLRIVVSQPPQGAIQILEPFEFAVRGPLWHRLSSGIFKAQTHGVGVKAEALSKRIAEGFAKEMGVETGLPSEPLGEPKVVIESRKLNLELDGSQDSPVLDLSDCAKKALEDAAKVGKRHLRLHFLSLQTWAEAVQVGLQNPRAICVIRRSSWPAGKTVRLTHEALNPPVELKDRVGNDWVVAWVG
jgi:hypothetical protein